VCDKKKQKKNKKQIVAGHYFYTPPHPDHEDDLSYFNILREPISRCQSRFYYEIEREGIPPIKFTECMNTGLCLLPNISTIPGYENKGYGELMILLKEKKIAQLEHAGYAKDVIRRLIVLAEECSSNHQTRWTCGMQEVCYKGTQDEVLKEGGS